MKPRKFDRSEPPFKKFRTDSPRSGGERPFRQPFNRDSRPDFADEEQYTASGELADVVGTHPLDRREILRRMWRHYQDAGLVKSSGITRRAPREGDRPPPRRFEDRPPRRFEDRPPRPDGDRERAPRRFEPRAEGAPRRYERKPEDGDRRFTRDGDRGPKRFTRTPSAAPRVSTRAPSGKHPAGQRAETISKVPRRKFKETREREEG